MYIEFQMVASGVGCWVEEQIQPINVIITSQKFMVSIMPPCCLRQQIPNSLSLAPFGRFVRAGASLFASVPFPGYQYLLRSMGTKVGHNTLGNE